MMDFGHSPKTSQCIERVGGFMAARVLPCEREYSAAADPGRHCARDVR